MTANIIDKGAKTMIALAIEHTLLKISGNTLDLVQSKLWQEYKCTIDDCYKHPEYLSHVLKDLFGRTSGKVIGEISSYLDEFSYQEPIAEFLNKIR